MKVNIGDISESELDLVMSAIRMSVLEEDKGRGVLVTCVNGMRTWQMNSDDTWITIPGDHHSLKGHSKFQVVLSLAQTLSIARVEPAISLLITTRQRLLHQTA